MSDYRYTAVFTQYTSSDTSLADGLCDLIKVLIEADVNERFVRVGGDLKLAVLGGEDDTAAALDLGCVHLVIEQVLRFELLF